MSDDIEGSMNNKNFIMDGCRYLMKSFYYSIWQH